jgi:hypothetical protein
MGLLPGGFFRDGQPLAGKCGNEKAATLLSKINYTTIKPGCVIVYLLCERKG